MKGVYRSTSGTATQHVCPQFLFFWSKLRIDSKINPSSTNLCSGFYFIFFLKKPKTVVPPMCDSARAQFPPSATAPPPSGVTPRGRLCAPDSSPDIFYTTRVRRHQWKTVIHGGASCPSFPHTSAELPLLSPPLFVLIRNTLKSAPEVFLAGRQTDTSPAVEYLMVLLGSCITEQVSWQ